MNARKLAFSIIIPALVALLTIPAHAATVVWSGANTLVNSNWSNAGNWAGSATPGVNDDVKFFDTGTNALGLINNIVDASTWTGSLQYGNTNGSHATLLPAGVTLYVTNANGLSMFTPAEPAGSKLLTNIVTGGGALTVSNSSARIALNQGAASAPSRATLDMSGLDTFTVTARAIGLGSSTSTNTGGANTRYGGQLFLAKTNVISLTLTDTLSNYQTSTSRTNAIEIVRAPGNNPGITCQLWLGQTNTFSLDSLGCGMDKSGNNSTASSGLIAFNPTFTNSSPGAYFRGVDGAATTRIKWWSVGDANASSSSANGGRGTNDFSNGTVDLLVDVMSLGRDSSAQNTQWPGPHSGLLRFTAGKVDVNTVYVGNQAFNNTLGAPGGLGIIQVAGPTATMKVNTTMILGRTTVATYIPGTSGTNVFRTSGTLSITDGGTVLANAIDVGAASITNIVTMNSGTLVISNAIGTPAKGLFTFATTNSTLQVNATGATNVVVTNLVVGGATNVIFPASVAVFSSYPKQITLVKYDSMTGAFNFGFGTNTLPAAAPNAYLSNNVANKSIDLVLPTDPRPSSTPPAGYSGSPGDNVLFSVTPSGAAPLAFQWRKDGGNIANGPTGNGSTNSGSTTASLSILNAQVADSGNYDLIITNAYGSFTSSVATLTISAGNIEPSITGPNNTTVIQSNNATLIASVSGAPIPFIKWQKDGVDIPGANSSSLTISNAQYPADQATYSIIATNEAGATTNSAFLTVIVPPVITLQPTNLVVTNTQAASFTVAATGVPDPTYQWRKNGSPIANQTNATLTFASVVPSDIATYTVVVQNAAGSVTSSNAALVVNSTMTPVALAPSNNATGICFDTPLYVTFSSAPMLRTPGTGKIRIYNSTNPATPVATLDMSLNTSPHTTYAANVQTRTIGGQSIATYPVIITGNTAAIYPNLGVLTTNQTYYVTIENGVFTDAAGAYHAGITDTNAWRFTTRPTLPVTATTNPIVNADGSADFVTIQGALDYLPTSGPARRLVDVRNGSYTEVVVIAKSNVTVRGQSRLGVKQQYQNNSWQNPSTRGRMSLHVRAADVAIESMSLTNMTPQGGSQAEALFLESGSSAAKRFIMMNCLVSSYQDTILGNDSDTPAYFESNTIEGQTDYIWGGATMYFTNCELRMLVSGGQYSNPSSSAGSNGLAFVGCTLTKAAGVTSGFLGRTRGITNGNAAFIYCNGDTHCSGWQADALPTNSFRLWHYGISNLTATVNRDVSISNSILLTVGDPRLTLALSATNWLYGWAPQLAPNITGQPTNQTVDSGQTATFTVTATGIPAPTYQWLKNGTNLVGQTGASLIISGTQTNDAGVYAVIVSNGAGSVTSSSATLTVNPVIAPVFTLDPTNQIATVGDTVMFTVAATGIPAPVFQWLKNGTNIDGATNTTLVLTNVQVGDSGGYFAVASNSVGTATSADATLTVTGPNGFCMINGTTTGGKGGTVVTVTNGTDFKTYAESTATYIIQVSGPITTGVVQPKSNKTIIGADTNATILGRLSISGATNVIVQNLRITNPGDDGISIINSSKNVWVDHVTFYDCGDGMCDATVQADYITVSWCKFYYTNQLEHRFTFLVGASENEVLDDGKLHITLHHNWWSTRADQRMATVRRGSIHYYNNYFNSTNNLYCSNARTNAQFLSENNFYSGVKSPLYKESNGLIKSSGNIYSGVNPSGGQPVDPGTDTVFVPAYGYLLDAAADVPALVSAGAGAPGPTFVAIPPKVWDGGGGDNNLNAANNWGFNENPKAYDTLLFAGNTRLAPNNNFTTNTEFSGLAFSNNAGAFVLGGNPLNFGNAITDDSPAVQTINLNLDFTYADDHFSTNRTFKVSSPSGSLVINGRIGGDTNIYGKLYSVIKSGPGLLTFAGVNTFPAALNLDGGLLKFSTLDTNVAGSLGSGNAINFNGGGLQWASGNTEDISARSVKFNAGGATLDVGANDVTFANAIGVGGAGGLTKLGTGTLALNGNSTFSGPTLIGQGTLALGTAGALPNSSQIVLSNAAVLDATGRSDAKLTLGSGKMLCGEGTVLGAFTSSSGSTVSPGFSIGTITVSSNITLGGTLYLELNRTNAQTSDKLLSSGGTITGGGILSVQNIGPALQIGDTFQLFPSAIAGFSSVILSPIDDSGAIYAWENRVAIDGTVKVIGITERIYAVTMANQLISFGNTAPGTVLSSVAITGLQPVEAIVGIDFRTNTLYAVGDSSRLYTINRVTGAATAVGGQFSPVLNGTVFGMEVDSDGVRVVTDLGQNLLLDFTTGAATVGTVLNGNLNNISGLARHPGTGQLYVADYFQNRIGTLNPTTGFVTNVGVSGVTGIDFSRNNGFDISATAGNTAYLATPAASSDPAANLYTINLGSGSASLVGLIGNVGDNFLIRGLAIGPDISPAAPVINPNPTNITFSASGGNLNLSWPMDHLGWILQSQTNSRAVGLNTNWMDMMGSESVTATNFPLVPANPTVFYRLRLP